MKFYYVRAAGFITTCLSLALSQHALADDVGTGDAGPVRSEGLEEITVTAQRREESASKVPISMSVLSQKTMDDLHVQSVTDLASIVPGLVIPPPSATNNANADIAIRGIFSGGNTPTTQIYIDETPIAIREMRSAGPSGSFFPDIFDLERVEVLRGPQGTLFGSSAMGGAIRFITPQPNLTQASGFAKLEGAFTDTGAPSYAVGAAYGAPLVEGKAGFRVSAFYHKDGGYIDVADPFTGQITRNDANSSDSFAGRAALQLVPVDGLTVTPAFFYQHRRYADLAAYWVRPQLGYHVSGDSANQPNRDDLGIPSLTVKYEFAGLALQSDTSFLDRNYNSYDDGTQLMEALFGNCILCDGIPSSFQLSQRQFGSTRAWQQQLRLSSTGPGRVQWVVGAYFRAAHESITQTLSPDLSPLTQGLFGSSALDFFGVPDYVLNGVPLTQFTDFNTIDEEKSVFAEVSLNLTTALKATAGVRAEHSVVKDQTQNLGGPFGGAAFQHIALPDQSQNPIDPRFSLTYQYTDRDMVYVSAAKGYRAGGANNAATVESPKCPPVLQQLGIDSTPLTFNSDSLWSYELGAKDLVLDGHLALQASVFHINWSGIQTLLNEQGCGNFTVNRGRATVNGFELQFDSTPLPGVKVGGSLGYTDAYYPDAQYGAVVDGVATLQNGAGDKLAQVYPWTASLHGEYSWSLGALWSGARSYVRADYRWQDGAPKANPQVGGYDPYLDEFRDPAYSILNLRLGVLHAGLDASVFVNNATNADPHLGFVEFGSGGPDYPLAYRSAIRPLTAGVTLLYHF